MITNTTLTFNQWVWQSTVRRETTDHRARLPTSEAAWISGFGPGSTWDAVSVLYFLTTFLCLARGAYWRSDVQLGGV